MTQANEMPLTTAAQPVEVDRQSPQVASNEIDLTAIRTAPLERQEPRRTISTARLATMVTVTWLVAIGSYVLGFISWSEGEIAETFSQMPMPDLLLFVLFCLVPLTLIWAVAAMAKGSGSDAAALRAQSESAAKITRELEALHEVATEQRRLLIKAFDTTAQELEVRFETLSNDLLGTVNEVTEEARATLSKRGEALDHAMARIENRVDAALTERLSQVDKGMGDAGVRIDAKIDDLGTEIRGVLAERGAKFDRMLAESQQKLAALVSSRLDETGGGSIDSLTRQLSDVTAALSKESKKPKAVQDKGLTNELDRLTNAVSQLCDRLDAQEMPAQAMAEPAKPFSRKQVDLSPGDWALMDLSGLDQETDGPPVDWAVLLGAMAFGPSEKEAGSEVTQDPILRRIVPLGRRLQSRLATEGLFVQDLTPDQAAPESWKLYAGGERNPELAQEIMSVSDPVAVALVQASMKGDVAFRQTAETYVKIYQKLIERAIVQERNGADLVALAETVGGKLFVVIGAVIGAFSELKKI